VTTQRSVLVVGATGFLGGEVVRLLRESGRSVRALVRADAAADRRDALTQIGGVELVAGDLKDPDSLQAACDGVDAIVSTATSTRSRREGDYIETVDGRGQLSLVEAAESRGVQRFVFVSFAPGPVRYGLARAKEAVEKRLQASRLDYVILQPTYFTEAWLGPALGFDPAKGNLTIWGDGNARVSWISLHDVARFAVAASERPEFKKLTLKLGGPDALSPLEVLAIFRELGAAAPTINHVGLDDLDEQRRLAKDPLSVAYAALKQGVAQGQIIDSRQQSELLEGRLTTVREYARQVLGK
jgi:uncharacterized protein YbjT (DUF2867 family)